MDQLQSVSLSEGMAGLFLEAKKRQRSLCEQWVKASIALGGRLPASLLTRNVQRDGDVDMLLRCIEDEIRDGKANLDDPINSPFPYLVTLSNYWVSSVYEALRLLRSRKLIDRDGQPGELFRAVELVRITIDKHEIAGDQQLKEPLQLVRQPRKGDTTDPYEYARDDNKRAHIMPMGLSPRGSVTWQPIDLTTKADQWAERRSISERVIELWGG
jgi:hypothetical protein